jgi:hypothetical protein
MQARRWIKQVCRPWLLALVPLLVILAAVAASAPQTASASLQAHWDWGDATRSYSTTLADNGARHILGSDVYLGSCVDAELDGQPTIDADGDDVHATTPVYGTCAHGSDEDGVTFVSPLFRGQTADIVVVASQACRLSAWMDFDASDNWEGIGENLFPGGRALVAGANPLTFTVPVNTEGGPTPARFRCTTAAGPISYAGEAPDGEVEDYLVTIYSAVDFGDAPDPPYPTLNGIEVLGAYHYLGSDVYLGSCVDAELNGQPTTTADGDDVNSSSAVYGTCEYGDDEDGVTFATDLIAGQTAAFTATANQTCTLSAWIDFNADGYWDPYTDESLFYDGQQLVPGPNLIYFSVPQDAAIGLSYARFRCTTYGVVGPSGYAGDGEVEDYQVWLGPPLDFGDAPDADYQTLASNDGARHALGSGIYLGSCVDAELDGQPTLAANGDDISFTTPISGTCAGSDDEDGVTFTTDLIPGETAEVKVVASAACTLNAWIDYNADGDWWGKGEKLPFSGQALISGTNMLSFDVPVEAEEGPTYARFRCTSSDLEGPAGYASDGEVEDYRVRIGPPLDFGDAALDYPTLITDTGPTHVLGSAVYLGSCVDGEFDGQPTANSDGDDANAGDPVFGICEGSDDEDGVTFTTALITGQMADVQVVANAACDLSAWIDFNGDGDWADAGEALFSGEPLAAGPNVLGFAVPAGAAEGITQARFRCTTDGIVGFTGPALDGEVEDYRVNIGRHLDLGDVPDPTFPTLLASNGASHVLGSDVYLGDCVDAEPDGQPTADATGDDLNVGSPVYGTCTRITDEDGVGFVSPLYPGGTTHVVVRAHAACTLSGWVDFNADGDWADPGENLFPSGESLTAGLNPLSFAVPVGAVQGATYARLRCTTDGVVGPTGEALDGEVEDYRVVIGPPIDFGDAPDAGYLTLLASGGASHALGSDVYLGSCVDAEGDGQPTVAASGDDTSAGAPVFGACTDDDDEDGVTFTSNLLAGQQADVEVVANTACMLSGWVDFNADGDWADAGETLFLGQPLVAGVNNLTFAVPAGAVEGLTYARFRCATAGVVSFAGPAIDGEVEDYQVNIGASLDWGDAPEPYTTTLEVGGPSHALGGGVYLGGCVDAEQDGQPSIGAGGDDANSTQPVFGVCTEGDDEDGVTFSPLLIGETADVEVVAGAPCRLSAWIDFNADGDWEDAGETLFSGRPLVAGVNSLTFTVPAGVDKGSTYARFRCASGSALEPTGAALDGEVEDYRVAILAPVCRLPLIVRAYSPAVDAPPASGYRKK